MKFHTLRDLISAQEVFDFSTVLQLSGEKRTHLRTQLHRWVRAGKLIPLRKGLYAFAATYRRRPINPGILAGVIYTPSYLSLQWVLGFYGLIPEQVITLTSVTTRQTSHFENEVGSFDFRHVKPALFTGFAKVPLGGVDLWMASPEKALLDFWYLESGPWTAPRMREMRFQNFDQIDPLRLEETSSLFASRRIDSAVAQWFELAESDEEKGEEL
jgi:hypothetical protein